MGRDTVQLETAVNTISHEYLLEFTSEYGIPEILHPALPGPKDRVVDFPEDMDLFSLIRAPNPTKVKVGSRPRAPHEVPLLTLTANRVIEMDDPATASDSSSVPLTIKRSPLDFFLEVVASDQGAAASEVPADPPMPAAAALKPSRVGVAAADPPATTESRKRGRDGTDANAPPSHCKEIKLILGPPKALMGERDSLSYSWAWLLLLPCLKMHLQASVTQIPCVLLILQPVLRPMSPSVVAAEDPESENASFPTEVGSPGGIYRPEWGVTNGSLLDTPEACQDLVDHVAPPGYFSKLCHMRNEDFLGQYNVNLARQVALGSQLRLRFEQEAKLLRKSVAQVASLNEQVSGEEKLKAAFEEFKRYEDERVERRCAELDARLDVLSIDFDEELYPHMLTAIAGRRVAKGMSEGLKHRVEHGQAQLTVESIEAYDPEAESKFVAALQSLKDLKYHLLDQLEGLKDAPMDVIMAALYLESDTRGMPHNIYVTSAPAPLSSPSPCTRRSDGVLVSVPTVVP
uniref:Transposase (Putative), gypsy type n=1 Tax=Tanacetum cinerariifolium TaxID=118510 RepID=A0A6L2J1P1_TANCI|nr:hypothetical protein [Tanacetum cinerariifolium]